MISRSSVVAPVCLGAGPEKKIEYGACRAWVGNPGRRFCEIALTIPHTWRNSTENLSTALARRWLAVSYLSISIKSIYCEVLILFMAVERRERQLCASLRANEPMCGSAGRR